MSSRAATRRYVWAVAPGHGMAHLVVKSDSGVLAMRAACQVDAVDWTQDDSGPFCGLCKEARRYVSQ